jgi:hypothetical protein
MNCLSDRPEEGAVDRADRGGWVEAIKVDWVQAGVN